MSKKRKSKNAKVFRVVRYIDRKTGRFTSKRGRGTKKISYLVNREKLREAARKGGQRTAAIRQQKKLFISGHANYLGALKVGFEGQIRYVYQIPFTRRKAAGFEPDENAIREVCEYESGIDKDTTVLSLANVQFRDLNIQWYRVTDTIFANQKDAAGYLFRKIKKSLASYTIKKVLEIQLQFARLRKAMTSKDVNSTGKKDDKPRKKVRRRKG